MKSIIKLTLLCLFTFISASLYAATTHHATASTHSTKNNHPSLTFGVEINPADQVKNELTVVNRASYQHFVTALSHELKAPVKLVVYSQPMELANAVTTGKIDLAYSRIVPFIKANLVNKNSTPLVTVLSWNQDKTKMGNTSSSYLTTLASNTNINKIADLKNAKFGFAKNSASGYYFPARYLQKQNIAYSYHFFDSQAAALQALKQGKVNVIALWDTNYNLQKSKSELKTIYAISNIPNPIIVASNKLSSTDQAKIKQALLALPKTAYKGLTFVGTENYNPTLYNNAYAVIQSVAGPSA